MKKIVFFLVLGTTLLLTSCNGSRVFELNKSLPEEGWDVVNKVPFEVEITDTNFYYDLSMNLRIHSDYRFSNMFVILNITDPEGVKTRERVELTLAHPDGKWMGKGLGDILSFQQLIVKNKKFSHAGKYEIELEQNMRTDVLGSVLDVGLRVDKRDEIF